MLSSTDFFHKLLATAVLEGDAVSHHARDMALDLLVWIAAVSLCGPPIGDREANGSNYQLKFISAIQSKLSPLVLQCILFAYRSTAHKCSKLLVLCIE
jgi:hypothetical protein